MADDFQPDDGFVPDTQAAAAPATPPVNDGFQPVDEGDQAAAHARELIDKHAAGEITLDPAQLDTAIKVAKNGEGAWTRAGKYMLGLSEKVATAPWQAAKMLVPAAKFGYKTGQETMTPFVDAEKNYEQTGSLPQSLGTLYSGQLKNAANFGMGVGTGLAEIPVAAAGAAGELGDLAIEPFSPDAAAKQDAGLYNFEHTMRSLEKGAAAATGTQPESAMGQAGQLASMAAIPAGGAERVGAATAKIADAAVEKGVPLAGKVISGTAKAAPAGTAAAELATGHPLYALGTLLAGYGEGIPYVRRIKQFVYDKTLGAVDKVGQALSSTPDGVTVIGNVRNGIADQIKAAQDDVATLKSRLTPDELGDLHTINNSDLLSAKARKVREEEARIEELKAKNDKLENWEKLNKVGSWAVKKGIQSTANLGVAGGIGAAFSGAGAAPGESPSEQGFGVGALMGVPFLHAINTKGTLDMNRGRLIDLAANHVDENHPLYDQHTEAMDTLPKEAQDYVKSYQGLIQGSGNKIIVLQPDQLKAQLKLGDQAAVPNGYYDKSTGTAYVNSDALASGVVPHEVTHAIDNVMGDSLDNYKTQMEKVINSQDPDTMGVMLAAMSRYEAAFRKTHPDYKMSDPELRDEITAALGADLFKQVPPEALYGGKDGGVILKEWIKQKLNLKTPQKVTDQFHFPVSGEMSDELRNALYKVGQSARTGEPLGKPPEVPKGKTPEPAKATDIGAHQDAVLALQKLGHDKKTAEARVQSAIDELGPDATTADVAARAFQKSAPKSAMPAERGDKIESPAVMADGLMFTGKTHDEAAGKAKKLGLDNAKIEKGFAGKQGFLTPDEASTLAEDSGQIKAKINHPLSDVQFNRDRLFMPSDHPDALDRTAIRRISDGKVFTGENARIPHWMIPNDHPKELADAFSDDSSKRYETGYLDKKGKFLNLEQGHDRAKEIGQVPADLKTEYTGELHSNELNKSEISQPTKLSKATLADKAGAIEEGEPAWSKRLRQINDKAHNGEKLTPLEEGIQADLYDTAIQQYGSFSNWFKKYGEKPYLDKTGIGPAADKLIDGKFMPSTHPEAIDDTAIRTPDGKIHTGKWAQDQGDTVGMQAIHPDIRNAVEGQGYSVRDVIDATAGYVDKQGKFYDRQQAFEHAKKIRQIEKDKLAEYRTGGLESSEFENNRKFMPKSHATHPNMVNIGLDVKGGERMNPADVIKAIEAKGINVVTSDVHQSGTEPTLVASLDRALTPEEAHDLSAQLKQEAIAQFSKGVGSLHGPEKSKWEPFNPAYFLNPEGHSLVSQRTGASGIWDSTFVSGEGQDKRLALAKLTGANEDKHFFEQKPDVQKKIQDTLKATGEAQFMPASEEVPDTYQAALDRYNQFHSDAVPLTYQTREDGTFKMGPDGKPLVTQTPYDLSNTPEALKAKEGVKGKEAQREAVVTTLAKNLGKIYNKVKNVPEIAKASGWYKEVRNTLRPHFDSDADTWLFCQALGVTSAGQRPRPNLEQAIDLFTGIKTGRFDDIIARATKLRDEGKLQYNDKFLRANDLLPTMSTKNAKGQPSLYGTNSPYALQVMMGDWAENAPLKTGHYAANFAEGQPLRAIIDMWAARTSRRAMGGQRITPKGEMGVSAPDYKVAQDAFHKAAEKAGIDPDDFQAILWFAEKNHWDKMGWQEADRGDIRPLLPSMSREGAGLKFDKSTIPYEHKYKYEQKAIDKAKGPSQTLAQADQNLGRGEQVPSEAGAESGQGLAAASAPSESVPSQSGLGRSRVAAHDQAWSDLINRNPNKDWRPDHPQFMPSDHPDALKEAAIRIPKDGGKIYSGPTHAAALEKATQEHPDYPFRSFSEQGFVTNGGEFLDRKGALKRAAKLKQIGPSDLADIKAASSAGRTNFHAGDFEAARRFMPSDKEIGDALSSDKVPYIGAARSLPKGTPVGLRIDIPAYERKGTYVQTIHEAKSGGRVGKRIGYDGIAAVDDPSFFSAEKGAQMIKEGHPKFPIATVEGKYDPSIKSLPEEAKDWTQVGYNPKRHSYFYDKSSMEPVVGGDKAISTGNTVYVKNPVYGERKNFAFMPSDHPEAISDTAVKGPDGKIYTGKWAMEQSGDSAYAQEAKTGAIHDEIQQQIESLDHYENSDEHPLKLVDGFVDKKGKFYNRDQAFQHATKIKQLYNQYYKRDMVNTGYERSNFLEADNFDDNRRFMPQQSDLGFYSKLEQTLEDKMPNKASAQQIKGIINSGGIKAEEVKWSGIDDFLKDKPTATKEEVLNYLKANNVQVHEVMLGEGDKDIGSIGKWDDLVRAHKEAIIRKFPEAAGGPAEFGRVTHEQQNSEVVREWKRALRDRSDYIDRIRYDGSDASGNKYARPDLLTPGAKEGSQRELLLTVPREIGNNTSTYVGGHYKEPNMVAHVRFNERTGPNGEKILHMEEAQSDWAGDARKKGIKDPAKDQANIDELQALNKKGFTNLTPAELERMAELQRQNIGEMNKVPDAPFIKGSWPSLVMKRMIRYAAEKGYDKLTWTTGEQQANRYDLSHHMDQVDAMRGHNNNYVVSGYKNDHMLFSKGVSEKELSANIGKDLAQKIVADLKDKPHGESKEYSGLDLKVGGEWAKNLYDKTLVNTANDLGKKFGARVDKTDLNAPQVQIKHQVMAREQRNGEMVPTQTETSVWVNGEQVGLTYGDPHSMDRLADSYRKEHPDNITVHSLTITPEMRKSVMEQGQPLFMPAQKGLSGLPEPKGGLRSLRPIARPPNQKKKELQNAGY